MNWIRKVSLVRRVTIGFTGMGTLVATIGGTSLWCIHRQAAQFEQWVGVAGTGKQVAAGLQAVQTGASTAM